MKDIKRTPELKKALEGSLAHWRENEKLPVREGKIGIGYCAVCLWAINEQKGDTAKKCFVCPLTIAINPTRNEIDDVCCNGLWQKALSSNCDNLSSWSEHAKAMADFIESILIALFPAEDTKSSKQPDPPKREKLRHGDFCVDGGGMGMLIHYPVKVVPPCDLISVNSGRATCGSVNNGEHLCRQTTKYGNVFDLITAMQSAKKAGSTNNFNSCLSSDTRCLGAQKNTSGLVSFSIGVTTETTSAADARQFAMELLGLTIEDEGK
jgi:hypothetical protein